MTVVPLATSTASTPSTPTTSTPSSGIKGIKWSVYLSKSKPTRHVTVIPINNNNNNVDIDPKQPPSPTDREPEITTSTEELPIAAEEPESEHVYDAIFELDENSQPPTSASKTNLMGLGRSKRDRRRQQSPPPKAPPLPQAYETINLASTSDEHRRSKASNREGGRSPQPPFKEPVGRRFSDRRESRHSSGTDSI